MAEYVAPKSKTLDLKAMTIGNDFKTDTSARGVIYVKIKRAFDFKAADMAIPLIHDMTEHADAVRTCSAPACSLPGLVPA